MMLDPKLAELRKSLPKATNPPLFGWTSEMHLLSDIGDLIYKYVTRDPAARLPRPLTALDHLSLEKRQARMDRAVTLFSPQHKHLTPKLRA
ncbi:hypothetical protein [Nocardia farcinica]|uniref:hypothetical protein n=1 Tax=Nocardia farcinica TaxID=37329 RepID=UPI002457C39A|nr:hypothetical protein [Nocardia farcinica]